ncbi:uncharacterized protein LOC114311289 [Camellia sinensis]|uniref:uncharacterized protein LOC114311289 n=1 Tax=Camellia sinensis TaxID=4442 RepID=UPI0010362D75|nr:uncharacterized protein LOC114311289 [Camellia sinensis]
MFASKEWARSTYSTSVNAKKAQGTILGDARCRKAIKYCLKCVLPLVKILRLVDGDAKLAMGFIYEAMDRAKEEIASNLNHVMVKFVYEVIFLSRFHYQENFTADTEVKIGLFKTIERMSLDIEDRLKVDEQLEKFKKAEGMFGMSMAILIREKKQPSKFFDYEIVATGCERNWSTFDHVHSKKRNQLEQQRLNALVIVKYNVQLELRQIKRQERHETYDPIYLSDMESNYEWIIEKEDPCLPKDHSWMDIQECFEMMKEQQLAKREKTYLK